MLKVKKRNLILFTGFIWIFATIMLLKRAYSWIDLLTNNQLIISILLGLIIALVKGKLIFHKLTIKNITRIKSFADNNVSILKFHLPKDQILIVVMIATGSLLRSATFIPKSVLMPIYIGIGLAMFYVSILYLISFSKYKDYSYFGTKKN